MEKPDSGVHTVVVHTFAEVQSPPLLRCPPPPWATSVLKPPQKICGTTCVAETRTALQGGGDVEKTVFAAAGGQRSAP